MKIRSTNMRSKSLLKVFTLLFFVSLLTFFVLFQSGLITGKSKRELIAGNKSVSGDSTKQKQLGLSTFQKLKLWGAFDPENFDAMIIPYSVPKEAHLSSSKSMIIDWDPLREHDTYLESVLETQFERKKKAAE